MNLEVPPTPTPTPTTPRHARLTRFICQELLYEFVTGHLYPERQKAMDDHLTGCRDSQRELESLRKGLDYALLARRVEVSPRLKGALLEFEPQWKKVLREWTLWSSSRGWRILPHVFVLIAAGLAVFLFKPWARTTNNDLVLLEQVKTEPDIISAAANIRLPTTGVSVATHLDTPPVPRSSTDTLDASGASAVVPNTQGQNSVATNSVAMEEEDTTPQLQGALTRGDLEVQDFAHAWPAIRDKIQVLGGHVAGNVDLGWLRHPNEAYFHFSLPESNREELDLFLKTFGPVRFSTERHLRVMPEGQIRIILTVKDGENTNEAKAP